MSEECGVCITADVDGYYSVYNPRTIQKSRKEFKCSECRRVIPVGSKYFWVFSVYEGCSSTFRTCVACEDIANAFYCDSRSHGSLWSDANDSGLFSNLTTACFAKLKTPEGRDYLRERWMKWKGLSA